MIEKAIQHMNERVRGFANMVGERRIGFKMDEIMTGTHRFEHGVGREGEHFMQFRITFGPEHITDWLNPLGANFMTQPLKGFVDIEYFCENKPVEGLLHLKYLSEQSVMYDFTFDAYGHKFRYVGENVDIRPWNLHKTHTTCYGELYQLGSRELISRSVTHFELGSIPQFLASFRLE